MKKKNFLENNGYYWIEFNLTKIVEIGKYNSKEDMFTTISGTFSSKFCEVKSKIILRPTN